MAQSKDPPEQWRGPAGGSVRPCPERWRLAVIVAGAPAIRMSATIFTTIHHGQWGGMSLKISVREGDFCPNSLKAERARWAVWHHTIYTVEENQSDSSEPMPWIMRGASAFSLFKPCNAHLLRMGTEPV
jgi:hypothetical protein